MMSTPSAPAITDPQSARTRITELDVLRGIAALAVVGYHYMVAFPVIFQGAPEPRVPYGVFAVHLFFMISGFVIFMTLARTRTALDFAVSRFSRLYPVFWVAVLTTWTVVSFAPLPGRTATFREVLVNFTMLAEPLHATYVDGVYWTLVVELAFYAIMLGFFVAGWLRRIERLVVPWLLLQIGVSVASAALEHPVPKIVAVLFLLKYAHLFLAGILFYRIRFEGPTRARHALLVCCLATQFIVQGVWAGAFAAVFFALFHALATGRLAPFAVRPLVFLGTISYSLYLVHQNIGYVVIRALGGPRQPFAVATAIVVALALATVLTFAVEQPSLRLLRTLYKRLRAPRPAAGPVPTPSQDAAIAPSVESPATPQS